MRRRNVRKVGSFLFLFTTLVLVSALFPSVTHAQSVVSTANVGSTPYGAAYDPTKGEVFVANDGSNNVSVISDTTDTVVTTINVGSNPWGVAYDSGKGEIFVTNSRSDTVSIISDTTDTVIARVNAGITPFGATYDPNKGEVFVANDGSNTVSVINDSTNAVVATVNVGGSPFGITYDSGKGEIFVANALSNTVSVISDATNTVIATITVGGNPFGLAYDAGAREVFVANDGSDTVSVISDATNAAVGSISVGSKPFGVAYDQGRGEVFVANELGTSTVGTLSVISDGSDKVVGTVDLGISPFGLAFDPAKGEVFVTNSGSDTVSVVSAAGPSSTTVSCSPSSISGGSSTKCTATVNGASPSGTITFTQSGTGSVTFPSMTTCALVSSSPASSQCQLIVTGKTAGIVTLKAIYGGDSNNIGGSSGFVITVSGATLVVCTSPTPVVGTHTTCKAAVTGSSQGGTPTGRVTWTSSGPGKFSTQKCELSKGACSVRYTPTSAGSNMTITATYAGDKHNPSSVGTFLLTVALKVSKTMVSCKPAGVVAGSTTVAKCMAMVTGYSPTGTVEWSSSGTGAVSFPAGTSCTLAKGGCSVTIAGTSAGTVTITATYVGDANNTNSDGSRNLTVRPG